MNEKMPKLLLIDRDGVILKHVEPYILTSDEVSFVDGSDVALKKIASLGIKIAVVSNQSPIMRGYITSSFVDETNEWIRSKVNLEEDVLKFYYCPHVNENQCDCRKPKAGMLLQALKDFGYESNNAWMIGDADTDMQAGRNAKVEKCIHLLSGRQDKESPYADCEYINLKTAIDRELKEKRSE